MLLLIIMSHNNARCGSEENSPLLYISLSLLKIPVRPQTYLPTTHAQCRAQTASHRIMIKSTALKSMSLWNHQKYTSWNPKLNKSVWVRQLNSTYFFIFFLNLMAFSLVRFLSASINALNVLDNNGFQIIPLKYSKISSSINVWYYGLTGGPTPCLYHKEGAVCLGLWCAVCSV